MSDRMKNGKINETRAHKLCQYIGFNDGGNTDQKHDDWPLLLESSISGRRQDETYLAKDTHQTMNDRD